MDQSNRQRTCGGIERLSKEAIQYWMTPEIRRYNIEIYSEIDSTNNRAKALGEEGTDGPAVILAERQTAGRGRLNRPFLSQPSKGLYMSLLCRPALSGEKAVYLTTYTAVAVCRAIEAVSGVSAQIKWVNDIFVQNKKICGILAEASLRADGTIPYAVIGIGVNIAEQKFPPPLHLTAGSLETFASAPVSRNRLAAEILREIGDLSCNPPTDGHLLEYRRRSMVLGRSVHVMRGSESFDARVLDIDHDGSLVIESGGATQILRAGEVSIRPDGDSGPLR